VSTSGVGIFFDGLSNARHPVAVALADDAVEISSPGGGVVATWRLAEIAPLATPKGVLRLGRTNSKEAARLEIRDAALATELIGRAKRLSRSGLTDRGTCCKVAALGIAAVVSLVASAIWGVPFVAERLAPRLPVTAELRLGDAVDVQVRRMLGAGNGDKPFDCGNEPGHEAGRAAFNKLVAALESTSSLPMPVRAAVVRTPVANAIALPGGRVYLFNGLLAQAQSPDEVAGVLGHELGHVAHRDGTKSVLEAGGISVLFGVLLGDFTGGGAAVVAAQTVLQSANSRHKEAAADRFGAVLMSKLGAEPSALGNMLRRLSRKGTQVPHFLLDHPDAEERAGAIAQVAPPAVNKPLLATSEWVALKRICS
jgi:Zn-dependent protease with chaperone function